MLFLLPGFGFLHAQDSGTAPAKSSDQKHDASYKLVVIPESQTPPANTAVAGGDYTIRRQTEYYIKPAQNKGLNPNVLLLCADDDNSYGSPIQALLIAYGDLGSVDLYDAWNGTPSLAQLLAYNVVVTWSNASYADPVGIGNVLADYVDAGGKVINMTFSIGNHGWNMAGRFIDQNYTAMNGTYILYQTYCLGSFNAGHPIMNGVTNVCDFFPITGPYLTPGSTAVASYDNGDLLVAVKDNKTVVTINGYVGYYYQWTGQMPDILHNSILWIVTPESVPISNWALYLGIFLIVLFTAIRFRRMI